MLNTISTPTFDPDGFIELLVRNDTTAGEVRRRTSRVATLDGGAVINDFGYTEADRTITLRWQFSSKDIEADVDRLVRLYDRLQVATSQGVFLAAPEVYIPGVNESTLRLLVLSKLSS